MSVWLEPWADEFVLRPLSTVQLRAPAGSALGEIEQSECQITVWATAEFVQVLIDGELQHSGSAVIPVPQGLTKKMLQIVFDDQPAARLGGATAATKTRTSWWKGLKARWGF